MEADKIADKIESRMDYNSDLGRLGRFLLSSERLKTKQMTILNTAFGVHKVRYDTDDEDREYAEINFGFPPGIFVLLDDEETYGSMLAIRVYLSDIEVK